MILRQIDNETPKIENEYKRAVREEGNVIAQEKIDQVFDVTSREWRGFPKIPNSILEIKEESKVNDGELNQENILEENQANFNVRGNGFDIKL